MRLDRLLITAALLVGVIVATPATAHADDTEPPQINISMPLPEEAILRGGSVYFEYSCTDDTDPTPSCVATVTGNIAVPVPNPESGTGWDQAEVGNFTITVDAQDASGNVSQASQNFSVVDAMCAGQVVTVIRGIGEEPTAGPDVILGNGIMPTPLDAGGGNDVICLWDSFSPVVFGGSGNDRVIGGAGRDVVFGGTGNDRIEGRGGNDRIEGDEGTDTLLGGTEADRIEGGSGNDAVNGGPQSDSCHGQEGARDTKAQCEIGTGFP